MSFIHISPRTVSRLLIPAVCLPGLLLAADSGGSPPTFFDFWLIPRVWMSAIFAGIGLLFLMKSKKQQNIRFLFQALAFFMFGAIALLPLGDFSSGMGLHPSPVCLVTKPILWQQWPLGFISILVSIIILSLIGAKLFCGWVCPIGALQEMFNRVSFSKKWNKRVKRKLPFAATNSIRIVLFILFVILALVNGTNVYEYINAFEFLHWGFEALTIIIILVTIALSLFIYRPFCYLVCPMGLLTWIIEKFSYTRVRFEESKCTHCNICIRQTACPTVEPIMESKTTIPDCHACGRCLEVCPEGALRWGKK